MSDVMSRRRVVESPLAGDFVENFRYLLWCCRQEFLEGNKPVASHLICPWFMNDLNPEERALGIDWPWMWQQGVAHVFYTDRGFSSGMQKSLARCRERLIPSSPRTLYGACRDGWLRGEWPPHTPGFELSEVPRG
jgi:hypothetical protein